MRGGEDPRGAAMKSEEVGGPGGARRQAALAGPQNCDGGTQWVSARPRAARLPPLPGSCARPRGGRRRRATQSETAPPRPGPIGGPAHRGRTACPLRASAARASESPASTPPPRPRRRVQSASEGPREPPSRGGDLFLVAVLSQPYSVDPGRSRQRPGGGLASPAVLGRLRGVRSRADSPARGARWSRPAGRAGTARGGAAADKGGWGRGRAVRQRRRRGRAGRCRAGYGLPLAKPPQVPEPQRPRRQVRTGRATRAFRAGRAGRRGGGVAARPARPDAASRLQPATPREMEPRAQAQSRWQAQDGGGRRGPCEAGGRPQT